MGPRVTKPRYIITSKPVFPDHRLAFLTKSLLKCRELRSKLFRGHTRLVCRLVRVLSYA